MAITLPTINKIAKPFILWKNWISERMTVLKFVRASNDSKVHWIRWFLILWTGCASYLYDKFQYRLMTWLNLFRLLCNDNSLHSYNLMSECVASSKCIIIAEWKVHVECYSLEKNRSQFFFKLIPYNFNDSVS